MRNYKPFTFGHFESCNKEGQPYREVIDANKAVLMSAISFFRAAQVERGMSETEMLKVIAADGLKVGRTGLWRAQNGKMEQTSLTWLNVVLRAAGCKLIVVKDDPKQP